VAGRATMQDDSEYVECINMRYGATHGHPLKIR